MNYHRRQEANMMVLFTGRNCSPSKSQIKFCTCKIFAKKMFNAFQVQKFITLSELFLWEFPSFYK